MPWNVSLIERGIVRKSYNYEMDTVSLKINPAIINKSYEK